MSLKLAKDKIVTVRINSEVKKKLEDAGGSLQAVFDRGLEAELKRLGISIVFQVIGPKKN